MSASEVSGGSTSRPISDVVTDPVVETAEREQVLLSSVQVARVEIRKEPMEDNNNKRSGSTISRGVFQ